MRKKYPEIQEGDIFEDIKVLSEVEQDNRETRYYYVQCMKCNRVKEMSRGCLVHRRGTSHSACAHGLRNTVRRFHTIWQGIRSRTCNPNMHNYKWYGGKGISSEAFKYFIDFYDTMYESYVQACELYGENSVSIDRIDYDKDYCPSNCRWIKITDQQQNTSRMRWFKAFSPNGEVFIANNQRRFASNHNLSDKQINSCLNGRFRTHFGWKFEYIECNDYPEIANEYKEIAIGVRPTESVGR